MYSFYRIYLIDTECSVIKLLLIAYIGVIEIQNISSKTVSNYRHKPQHNIVAVLGIFHMTKCFYIINFYCNNINQ